MEKESNLGNIQTDLYLDRDDLIKIYKVDLDKEQTTNLDKYLIWANQRVNLISGNMIEELTFEALSQKQKIAVQSAVADYVIWLLESGQTWFRGSVSFSTGSGSFSQSGLDDPDFIRISVYRLLQAVGLYKTRGFFKSKSFLDTPNASRQNTLNYSPFWVDTNYGLSYGVAQILYIGKDFFRFVDLNGELSHNAQTVSILTISMLPVNLISVFGKLDSDQLQAIKTLLAIDEATITLAQWIVLLKAATPEQLTTIKADLGIVAQVPETTTQIITKFLLGTAPQKVLLKAFLDIVAPIPITTAEVITKFLEGNDIQKGLLKAFLGITANTKLTFAEWIVLLQAQTPEQKTTIKSLLDIVAQVPETPAQFITLLNNAGLANRATMFSHLLDSTGAGTILNGTLITGTNNDKQSLKTWLGVETLTGTDLTDKIIADTVALQQLKTALGI